MLGSILFGAVALFFFYSNAQADNSAARLQARARQDSARDALPSSFLLIAPPAAVCQLELEHRGTGMGPLAAYTPRIVLAFCIFYL